MAPQGFMGKHGDGRVLYRSVPIQKGEKELCLRRVSPKCTGQTHRDPDNLQKRKKSPRDLGARIWRHSQKKNARKVR